MPLLRLLRRGKRLSSLLEVEDHNPGAESLVCPQLTLRSCLSPVVVGVVSGSSPCISERPEPAQNISAFLSVAG